MVFKRLDIEEVILVFFSFWIFLWFLCKDLVSKYNFFFEFGFFGDINDYWVKWVFVFSDLVFNELFRF